MFLFLTALTSAADAAEKPKSDIPAPKAGKTVKLIQRQKVVKPDAKQGTVTLVIEAPIEVEFLSLGDEGAVIRWKRGTTSLADLDMPLIRQNPELKPIIMKGTVEKLGPLWSATDNSSLLLILNRDMKYTGLKNLKEVQETATKSFDALDKMRAERGQPPMAQSVRDAIANPKLIEPLAAKDALYYLGWLGTPITRGGNVEMDALTPSVLGGEPTPVKIRAELAADADGEGRLVLHTTTTVDIETHIRELRKALERTPGAKPLEPEAEKMARESQMSVKGEYHIDPATGMATRAWHKKSFKAAGGQAQDEEYDWTVEPAEK